MYPEDFRVNNNAGGNKIKDGVDTGVDDLGIDINGSVADDFGIEGRSSDDGVVDVDVMMLE